MLGLEDLPHAAGADTIEDRVIAQDQRLSFARGNLLGLELCQVVLPDQFRNELFDALGVSLRRDEILQPIRSDNAAVFKLLDNGIQGDSHGEIRCPWRNDRQS